MVGVSLRASGPGRARRAWLAGPRDLLHRPVRSRCGGGLHPPHRRTSASEGALLGERRFAAT
eukprot:1851933-Prymnesium_polylepis.1